MNYRLDRWLLVMKYRFGAGSWQPSSQRNSAMTANKSITERIFQAIGFELLAILICTPLLAWIMGKQLVEMGAVTIAIALLALGWNVVFNGFFDRMLKRWNIAHNPWVRGAHSL